MNSAAIKFAIVSDIHLGKDDYDISYYTIPSLSEMKRGKPCGEWAEVTMSGKRISVAIRHARVR